MFEISIYFSIMYIIINYVNKGYFLKWHILEIISNNLLMDIYLIIVFIFFGILWIYIAYLVVKLKGESQKINKIIYAYCIFWTIIFVVFAFFFINNNHFYFTDRIFIVVISWALSVKNSSFCLDLIQLKNE